MLTGLLSLGIGRPYKEVSVAVVPASRSLPNNVMSFHFVGPLHFNVHFKSITYVRHTSEPFKAYWLCDAPPV
jgi:hypothetical protein